MLFAVINPGTLTVTVYTSINCIWTDPDQMG